MNPIPVGPVLLRQILISYRADVPVMVHGPHGSGKTQVIAEAARSIGIDTLSLDLSLLEPPDLIGIPVVEAGRTHFRPPASLPTGGRGLLVLEEINRCPRYMQAPAFQLLTERTLNEYHLPLGWLPIASVNDAEDGYQVEDLDAALLSRFAHLYVRPDPQAWCAWARSHNVHDAIVDFVARNPDIFVKSSSNPRSWTFASALLAAWEAGADRQIDDLLALLIGIVGETWALAFLQVYQGGERPPDPEDLIDNYRVWRKQIRAWIGDRKLDLVAAAWQALRTRLDDEKFRAAALSDPTRRSNIQAFSQDLPADLRANAVAWLAERGFVADEASLPSPRKRP